MQYIAENIAAILLELIFLISLFWLLNSLVLKLFERLERVAVLAGKGNLQKIRGNVRGILIFAGVVSCLAVLGVNGWLVYQGENIFAYKLQLLGKVAPDVWLKLASRLGKTAALLTLVGVSLPYVRSGVEWLRDRATKSKFISATPETIHRFFNSLTKSLTNTIWLLAVLGCAHLLALPPVVPNFLSIILQVYIIACLASQSIQASGATIDSLNLWLKEYKNNDYIIRFYPRIQTLIPLLKRGFNYIIYVSAWMGIAYQIQAQKLADIGFILFKIIGIIVAANLLVEIAYILVEESLLAGETITKRQRQRRLTIIPLLQSIIKYFIYFSSGIAILRVIGIDPTPIVAGAGIVGIAVGLGAQNLINDIVCGFFILFENYYLVGDFIETEGAIGTVEAIELRSTRIRHPNGQQQIIRNGDIKRIINYSKQYIYAVVEVGVAYESDLDRVYAIIEQIGIQLQEHYPESVMEPTRVEGLESFGIAQLFIRTLTKVKPGTHLHIQRVLRKMIKSRFDIEGIEIPHKNKPKFIIEAEIPGDSDEGNFPHY